MILKVHGPEIPAEIIIRLLNIIPSLANRKIHWPLAYQAVFSLLSVLPTKMSNMIISEVNVSSFPEENY